MSDGLCGAIVNGGDGRQVVGNDGDDLANGVSFVTGAAARECCKVGYTRTSLQPFLKIKNPKYYRS